VNADRISALNDAPTREDGRYVLYWMQRSQRAHFNPALEHAVARANALDLPVVVVFGLHAGYPEANARHFAFMLEGLAETFSTLLSRGIRLIARLARPGSGGVLAA